MKLLIGIFSLLLVLTISARPDKLFIASQELIQKTVPIVSTEKLAQEIDGEKNVSVVLLDTREKNEYEVSHLARARWVGYKGFKLESVKDLEKDAEIVVYCSIGYRSEKVGEKLKAAGFTNVRNLFAGIFAWANEGRYMENKDGVKTQAVHGYDEEWSKYLSSQVPKVLK